MKKTNFSLLELFTLLLLGFQLATGCSSGSTTNSVSSTSTLVLAASATSLGEGSTATLSVTGGTAPYSYAIVSGGGTLTASTTTYDYYTAPTTGSGTVEVRVTDTNSNTGYVYITLTGVTGSSVLSVSPIDDTVAISSTLAFTVSGGTEPYTFMISSGGGSFTSVSSTLGTATYVAPSTSQTVSITVSDSVGNTYQTYVYVGTTSTTIGTCEGTFTLTVGSATGTLTIIEDSNGSIAGSMVLGSYTNAITGTCTSSAINFTRVGQNQTWTGTLYINSNNTSEVLMSGTYSGNGSGSWFAHD